MSQAADHRSVRLSDFYRDQYALEVERRNQLTAQVSLPIGVFSLLGGALAVVVREIHAPLRSIQVVELTTAGVGFAAVCVGAYFVVRSLFNYTYHHLPTAKEIKDHREKLLSHYVTERAQSAEAVRDDVDAEVLEGVASEYADAADANARNNDRKSEFLHRANWALIASLIAATVTGVLHLSASIVSASPIEKVEVISLPGVTMTNSGNEQSTGGGQTAPQPPLKQQPAPAPTKPVFPPGRLIKEQGNPPKRG